MAIRSLLLLPSTRHQTHLDHVAHRRHAAVAARSTGIPPLGLPLLSEHSDEHCHGPSPCPIFDPSDPIFIRRSRTPSTSTSSSLSFLIYTPVSATAQPPQNPVIIRQNKTAYTEDLSSLSDITTMAPKSGYYESSHSSTDGDRVHYNPRREDRERSTASNTKKRTVVVTYGGKTGDPARKADHDGRRWK